MQYKKRILEKKVEESFGYYPVVAVLGARQVGKSTMVENLFHKRVKTVVFDPVVDIGNAREDPDFFLQNNPAPLFLDEIQYAPELTSSMKRCVDREKVNGRYIISGSQNLAVLRSIAESLAGRVAVLNLYPMTRREILGEADTGASFLESWLHQEKIDFQKYPVEAPLPVFPLIWRGGYPKIMEFPDHLVPGYWESYLQTYIERDVRLIANIGSLQTFGAFIGLLAAHSSQEINHAHLGRELGVDRKTVQAWTEIAQATFQWFSLPAFSRNPVNKIAGKHKGYFSDTGFLCYLQKIGSADAINNHPLKGSLFETYVVMEIIKIIQSWPLKPNLYHFRSYSGAEVDLVIELDGTLFPVEIKMKSNPSRNDTRGITAFRKCFSGENIGPGLIVCSVEQPRRLAERDYAVPWWML